MIALAYVRRRCNQRVVDNFRDDPRATRRRLRESAGRRCWHGRRQRGGVAEANGRVLFVRRTEGAAHRRRHPEGEAFVKVRRQTEPDAVKDSRVATAYNKFAIASQPTQESPLGSGTPATAMRGAKLFLSQS